MQELTIRIKELERQILQYKVVVSWLEQAQRDLAALKRAEALLREGPKSTRFDLQLTIPQAAELVLRKAGDKMHAKDIQEGMMTLGVDAKLPSIISALSHGTAASGPFKAYGKNLFGLKTWPEKE